MSKSDSSRRPRILREGPQRPPSYGRNARPSIPPPPSPRYVPSVASRQPSRPNFRRAKPEKPRPSSSVADQSRSRPPGLEELTSFKTPQGLVDALERRPTRFVDPVPYPMLYHTVPTTFGGLVRLRRELRRTKTADGAVLDLSPHFLTECRLARNLADRLIKTEGAERPRVLVEHLRKAYSFPESLDVEETFGALRRYVDLAREMIRDFIEDHVPVEFRMPFAADGVTDTINDPVELLLMSAQTRVIGQSPVARTRSFEIRRTLVLAQELMALDLGAKEEERQRAVERTLTMRLETDFFEPGLELPVSVRFALDERDLTARRILAPGEEPPAGTIVRVYPLKERFFRFGCHVYPVFYNPDQKRPSALLLKMLALSLRDPNAVPDRTRFLMVCRNRRELGACIQRLQETVFTVGGSTHSYQSNLRTSGVADPTNDASSPEYRFVTVEHWLHGLKVEGQYQTLASHLNGALSLTAVNHRFYKGQRIKPVRAALLLPKEIYAVDWDAPESVEALDRWYRLPG